MIQTHNTSFQELEFPGLSELERIHRLRDWAAREIHGCEHVHEGVDLIPDLKYYAMNFQRILKLFRGNYGGVFCGGAAYFLAKLYQQQGIETAIYNGGIRGTLASHAVTLARIGRGGEKIWVIEDCYLNATFQTPAGEPLPLSSLLELLRERLHDRIRFAFEPGDFPRILHSGGRTWLGAFGVERFLQEKAGPYFSVLESHGFPKDLSYLLAVPIGCWAPTRDKAKALRREIAAASRLDPGKIDLNFG